MQKKMEKKFLLLEIIPSELAALIRLYLRRENLWLAVNVFTNIQKILHIIKGDFFELHCLHIDE